jgi:hypothetical protein
MSRSALLTVERIVSMVMLTEFIWVVAFLLPKARRERDRYGAIVATVAGALALIAWLLMGISTRSR